MYRVYVSKMPKKKITLNLVKIIAEEKGHDILLFKYIRMSNNNNTNKTVFFMSFHFFSTEYGYLI